MRTQLHVEFLDRTDTAAAVGGKSCAVGCGGFRFGHQLAGSSRIAVTDVRFDLIIFQAEASTNWRVEVLGIDRSPQLVHQNDSVELIEVGYLAMWVAAVPGRVVHLGARFGADVRVERTRADGDAE